MFLASLWNDGRLLLSGRSDYTLLGTGTCVLGSLLTCQGF